MPLSVNSKPGPSYGQPITQQGKESPTFLEASILHGPLLYYRSVWTFDIDMDSPRTNGIDLMIAPAVTARNKDDMRLVVKEHKMISYWNIVISWYQTMRWDLISRSLAPRNRVLVEFSQLVYLRCSNFQYPIAIWVGAVDSKRPFKALDVQHKDEPDFKASEYVQGRGRLKGSSWLLPVLKRQGGVWMTPPRPALCCGRIQQWINGVVPALHPNSKSDVIIRAKNRFIGGKNAKGYIRGMLGKALGRPGKTKK